jgi:SAM-dependent methyltransferase
MGATSDPMYLDFGCGSGSMVLELSKTSVNAFGYDPDRDAILPELLEANSAVSDLEQLRVGPFSVVSLFHVVEHIYDIPKFLASIKLLLRSDGFLIIETPNARDALITKYECDEFLNFTFWSHHPNLCTNQFLDEALSDAGYAVLSSDQIQRYGINNHLHWLSEGAPGGHESWRGFIGGSADSLYADELISKGMADTIWIVASPNP